MSFFNKYSDFVKNPVCVDNHIHSEWDDGQGSIAQIARRSLNLGLKQIAVTNHVRADSLYFSDYADKIEKARSEYNVRILIGFEAKVKNLDGEADVSEKILERAEVSIISVHRFPLKGKLYYPAQFKKDICQKIELQLSLSALKKRSCIVLGHPGGMSLRAYNEFPESYFEKIILECKKNNIVFELNSSYHMPALGSLSVLLRKHNPLVSFGSDAHKLKDIGSCAKLINQNG